MAGVVAMPPVIEDFDSQPCKKSRKDGGSPVVKTITNYFSPVPKPVEKPFSPPRSNNIMNYFSKRTPSCKEKTSSSEQTKEAGRPHSAEKHTNPEAVKQLSQKRGRKTSKAARKLVGAEGVSSTEESSCVTVQESHESKDPAVDAVKSFGVLGSDTAALLAQLSAEGYIPAETSERNATKIITDEQAEKADHKEDDSKCVELKTELNTIELSPIVPSKYEAKQVKTTPQNTRKRQQQEARQSEPEEKEEETESFLHDISMEVNVDESSQLNSSTVRISFEDFVRSQSQDEAEEGREDEEVKEDDRKITNETKETNSDELNISKSEENMVSEELPSFQLSPRTVTIQAQVHVSPKQEASKAVGKLASIFNRKKGGRSPAEGVSPFHAEAGHQLPSPTTKRKSNVVLQEEDLELAVLESESAPKCSEVERKQFMAAFKQPTADGSKSKPVKSQSKQKQPEREKSLDAADKSAEAETKNLPTVEQTSQPSQGKKATKKKPAKKGRKKAKEGEEAVSASPPAATADAAEEETANTTVEVEEKSPESPIATPPSMPALRRSRREAAVQKAPETIPTSPRRKTRRQTQTESKDTDVTALLHPEDSPIKMSTPKTRKSKYGVFQSELMCPPNDKESPIRMKFTRSSKNVSKAEGINTCLTTKTSSESKKREQAKKLVQKAKVIQQNKKTVEEKSSLRRSSRTSIKRSYCEDEDSVICVEDVQTASPLKEPEKMKTQKPLRSLNDVLGKAAPPGKASSDSKVGSHSQDKTARKVSAVISIFDDSSREGSENSQDDEQFRARREFLKSGLPESFKKQIAKTAATKEAYSATCSSFQQVTHITQPPNDCSLWSLPWPESSLLCQLKELWSQTSKPLPAVGGSLCVKTAPACRSFCKRGSGWRPEISESLRQLLVEEFSTFNPQFPAQMFIARFLKKRADHQKQFTHLDEEAATGDAAESAGGKRKRMNDEGENTAKVAKKRRSNHSEENVSTAEPEPTKRGGRTRRSQRSRRGEEEEATEKTKHRLHPAPIPPEDDSVCIVEDLLSGEDTGEKDVVKEDVLWTDKYLPQHSSDIIGNTASVRRLHSWLKEWKLRADREERKKQKDKKKEDGSYDSDWDGGDDDSQDGEDMLCNTVLITGPTGVGKTAAVYACAQELGFKVFEVNASSQRSGRLILSQLKEATQSHQVDSQGVNAHKPTYFNSYGTSSSAGSVRPGSSPRKVNSPRRMVSSPRKPQSPRGAKKGCLTPVSLAKFFKTGVSSTKEPQNTTKAASKKVVKANEAVLAVKSPPAPSPKEKSSEEQSKKTATSLILFEEVDVIFDEDSGFLAAIKTFMTTTKRPVVLTTSDRAFSSMFDGTFEEIRFKAPSVSNASSYLRLLCLAEDMRTDPADIRSLLRLNGCDIRQSLLQLQFWTRSAGRHGARALVPTGKNETEVKPEPEKAADKSTLPPCETGCTESKLGLLNNGQERDILELLKSRCVVEEPGCWELLTDCKRRGVDLLYSNMELLLPLPLTHLTTSTRNPEQCASVALDRPSAGPKEQPSSTLLSAESADCSDSSSPVKVSKRMRKNKRRHHLPDQAGLDSDSDSEDRFLSLCKPQSAPRAKEEVKALERVKRKPLTPEERLKNLPVSQCLESIAEFLDSMSYMDSLLDRADSHRGLSPVSVVIKDGMTDESSVDTDRGSLMTAAGLEIQVAVEALSFHKCRVSAEEAWDRTRQLEEELAKEAAADLSLPVAGHQQCFSFTQDGPSQPQLVEQRKEVMESLMLKGVFGTLGNSRPAALDYLPIVRCICRSEQLKEQGKVKRRFLHYLDAIHLGLEKRTLQLLAEDFP